MVESKPFKDAIRDILETSARSSTLTYEDLFDVFKAVMGDLAREGIVARPDDYKLSGWALEVRVQVIFRDLAFRFSKAGRTWKTTWSLQPRDSPPTSR
jgi:hypothetical protein